MEDGQLPSLIILFGLLTLHGLIVLAYTALINCHQSPLHELADEGNPRATGALRLIEDPLKLQITSQLTLSLLRFGIAALGILLFVQSNADGALLLPPVIGFVMMLLLVGFITYITAELIPSVIGAAHADAIALRAAPFMHALTLLMAPFSIPLKALCRSIVRVSGADEVIASITNEEIMLMVDVGQKDGVIDDEEKEMIRSVLEFRDTIAREVMVPRPDIVGVEINTPLHETLPVFVESGHSRIPVYDDSIDNVKGLLYAKDLLSLNRNGDIDKHTIHEFMRPAYFVPEGKRADILFKEMQARKVHLAIIVDEYGGTAGLVTIEDLVEEIVGEIQDEYDINEEVIFEQHDENTFTIDASINLDDFNDLVGVDLQTDDSDTLGGFIFSQIGRVPEIGEIIETNGALLRIENIEGRRIRKVHVTRHDPPTTDDEPPTDEPVADTMPPDMNSIEKSA